MRLLTERWWAHDPARDATALVRCLHATGRNRIAEGADARTPWERGDDEAIAAFELDEIRRSHATVRTWAEVS